MTMKCELGSAPAFETQLPPNAKIEAGAGTPCREIVIESQLRHRCDSVTTKSSDGVTRGADSGTVSARNSEAAVTTRPDDHCTHRNGARDAASLSEALVGLASGHSRGRASVTKRI